MALSLALWKWAPLGALPVFPWPPGLILGLAILSAALVINVSGFLAFRRAGINVNSNKPAMNVFVAVSSG
ncbi:MAG: hypothetical protein R3E44_02830 [Paracoccaceae bacterium]